MDRSSILVRPLALISWPLITEMAMGTSCSPSARLVAVTMISSSVKSCDSAGALTAIASVAAAVYKLRVAFFNYIPLVIGWC